MRLYIKQKGYSYKFFENDYEQETLIGSWARKRKYGLFSKIFDLDGSELATVVLTNAPWFWELNKTTYRINLHKEQIEINVKAINYHKGHWTFNISNDKYDFHFHRGHKKSLFKINIQVAKYNKGKVHLWNRDSGFIIANNDQNKILLLSIFVMFDMGEHSEGDVNVDLGKLNGGVIENNEYWYPTN